MWKCSNCGRENEWNFCTNCQCPREASEIKEHEGEGTMSDQLTPQGPALGQLVSQEPALDQPVSQEPALGQPVPQEPILDQPMSQEPALDQPVPQEPALDQLVPQEGMWEEDLICSEEKSTVALEEKSEDDLEEKGGKKGCIAAIIVVAVIVSLIGSLIFVAVNMLISSFERDTEREVIIEIIPEERYSENNVLRGESPFNFDVWDSPEIVQIELGGVVLDVPMPPNAIMAEETEDCTAFFGGEDDWEDFYRVQVTLRNRMRGDFSEYFAFESEFNLEWHNDWAEVLDKQEYEERDLGLMVTRWNAGWDDGFTFTKIKQYQDFVLLVEIRFETVEDREELFEVYGFMEPFGEIILYHLSL